MQNLTILKIGGSVLTYKEDPKPRFRHQVADRIILEIVKSLSVKKSKLIIVVGTGSFGHPIAKEYGLDQGYTGLNSLIGFAKTKRLNMTVNNYFWQKLEARGLAVVPIQPSAIILNDDKKLAKMDLTIIKRLLKMSFIVMLFGDEVLDKSLGFSECSSDLIASYLTSKLKAKQLLYATDVDGVFNNNPKLDKNAQVFKSLDNSKLQEVISGYQRHNQHDVTGEMAGKLSSILQFPLNHTTVIRIFNGLTKQNVYKALVGKKIGTEVINSY